MNLQSKLYVGLGSLALIGCWLSAYLAIEPALPEVVPVSVRENPASFRPSYAVYRGFHPLPAPSSGGGFGFGK